MIHMAGHNYFKDLIQHTERKVGVPQKREKVSNKNESDSNRAQLALLTGKEERGEKMSVNEIALLGC
jgi:hypothetical protein